jgi:hypothetical protein
MEIEQATKKMEELELQWFEAHRIAEAARQELAAVVSGGLPAVVANAARAQQERAERRKREVMAQIEAIEMALIS